MLDILGLSMRLVAWIPDGSPPFPTIEKAMQDWDLEDASSFLGWNQGPGIRLRRTILFLKAGSHVVMAVCLDR